MLIKKTAIVMAAMMLVLNIAGCAQAVTAPAESPAQTVEEEKTEDEAAAKDEAVGEVKTLERKSLLPLEVDESEVTSITPRIAKYEVEPDLSNVINKEDFYFNDQSTIDQLVKNGFYVTENWGKEFFEIYESNRYGQIPNFVTVDSMMHTYHVYFAYLLRSIEKDHLYNDLSELTAKMLDASKAQLEELKGSEWENAATTNVALFATAAKLLDDKAEVPAEVKELVDDEYKRVMSAEGIDTSLLTGEMEDYSQYKPRGYYDGDETLEKYFRAMMWYGRRQYTQDKEDLDRSALLVTLALEDGNFDKWSNIYCVTSFFAGASDDLGYYEYKPVIDDVYGEGIKAADLAGKESEWNDFHKKTASLRPPKINSIPIMDTEENKDEDNVIPGFRFMGQRFTIDAGIMQQLVYRRVGEFEDEKKRMLPDFLDVPAALGSDMAYSILKDKGETDYKHYDENMETMRKELADSDTIWRESLYAGWLNTLRPLLTVKGEGYPLFMQNDEWTKKDLETFAGSYTELKHDTILYAKQIMAEMGGGWEEDKDFRGYVEPEPLVFLRFANLAANTAAGLKEMDYLSKNDEENLEKLADLANKLMTISVKELNDEVLTDDEYNLIEIYGGEIEHFWLDAMKAQTGEEYPSTDEYPAAVVVDVATDPNGSVLQMATGNPSGIRVIVSVDGKLRIAQGSVYSFYQFEQPINERLTDEEWRKKMGIVNDDYENWTPYGEAYDHPDWTMSYRVIGD